MTILNIPKVDFGIISYNYDKNGFSGEAKEISKDGVKTVINDETIINGSYIIKREDIANIFLQRAIRSNNSELLDKVLNYYNVPSENMNLKERVTYYYLLEDKE